jgi:predicted solute-binding protein
VVGRPDGGLPLPLGGNIIRRDLGPETIGAVSKMLHDSIAYALAHREEAVAYAISSGAASTASARTGSSGCT